MCNSFVQQIEPAKDAVRMEEGDKLVVNCLTHGLTTAEVNRVLEKQERLSKAVFSGHGGQFKQQ